MKHLYLFNQASKASNYGIGTYIEQICSFVRQKISVTLVNLFEEVPEFSVYYKKNLRIINIPVPQYHTPLNEFDYNETYQNTCFYLLIPYISYDEENIFHLHYGNNKSLAKRLKAEFNCDLIFTFHYSSWSIELMGDKQKFHELMAYKADSEIPHSDSIVIRRFEEEKELLTKYCDKIIAIANHSYNDLIDLYGVHPDKIYLINNGLKDEYKRISTPLKQILRQEHYIDKDETVILFAGRLDYVKGVDILLKAFKIVLDKYPHTRLVLAGDGNYKRWLSITDDIWAKVTFTGLLPRQKLFEFYTIADIGVIPSVHEEFGLVALEMMMHKLAIVTSNSTGLDEIIDDKINGLKFNIKQPFDDAIYELEQKMMELLSNPKLRIKFGRNARLKYRLYYEINKFKGNYINLINGNNTAHL